MKHNFKHQNPSLLILNIYLFDMIMNKESFYCSIGYKEPVVAFNSTGDFIGIYQDYIMAAKDHNLNPSTVITSLTNNDGYMEGFVFKFTNDILDDSIPNLIVVDNYYLMQKLCDLNEITNLYLLSISD